MSRYYKTDIGDLPSVTTIIGLLDKSSALMRWAVNCAIGWLTDYIEDGNLIDAVNYEKIFKQCKDEHTRQKDKAGDIGTGMHNVLETHIKGSIDGMLGQHVVAEVHPNLDDLQKQWYENFLKWEATILEDSGYWVDSEKTVYSKKGYAGTLDALFCRDGKIWLLDFKTSNRVYPTVKMQIGAYAKAVEEMTDYKVKGGGVLRLDKKTGKVYWKEYKIREINQAYKAFMCLVKFWHLWKEKGA